MTVIQLILFCLLFTLMVRYSVRGGAVNGLFYYPETVQERAFEICLSTREEMKKKRKVFMTEFYAVMGVALVLIIAVWNKVTDFKTAYIQALLFLEVMNWYDGIVIDKIWVGHSKFWILPGCEDLSFVQTWKQMFKKRIILTLIWVAGAAVVAGIVVLISRFVTL
ncbi:MAG: hypothetical protein E7386_04435 [Ruminococcaceae bacterium]|nr:hypothetical protein [Oscillospiraceae bacterium]